MRGPGARAIRPRAPPPTDRRSAGAALRRRRFCQSTLQQEVVNEEQSRVARALDQSIGGLDEAKYEETPQSDAAATYDVYRADVRGSEAMAIITDGQDRETIEAVKRDCDYVATIRRTRSCE